MAKICLCLTAKTIKRNLEILEKNRKWTDIAELRVDCLDPDERFLIRHFPEKAGIPVILTIRRDIDGGQYTGGEGARVSLFSKGLAFADVDPRRNFAYIDLEEDLNVSSLEDAARTFGTRIIRSFHNLNGIEENIPAKLRGLRRVGNELVKAAMMPNSLEDVVKIYRAAKETADMEKILLCMGHLGVNTRILAEKLGSGISYTCALGESDSPQAAPGQLDVRELAELYHFRTITADTRVFAVVGYPLTATSSPAFFNTVFGLEEVNAVYVPIPADSIDSFIELAGEIGIEGASITVPHKESILSHLSYKSPEVKNIGACNTILKEAHSWKGYNTDAMGFSDALLEFIDKKNLKGKRVTIIGAGGSARAVAAEVYRLGAKALILNRTAIRARRLALTYDFAWSALDEKGTDMVMKYADIIIQTTSVGMEPNVDADPLEFYTFSGKETVMDLIYKPEKTKFLKRALHAGCKIMNGYDMLIRQARYQYVYFMGREFPAQLVSRVRL
ncbi:MAG: type I 3-dehydroquinate dehydratase [Treponema sp.]|jgi:3-dehydroquinate dehydratase/shikimate dehydrogenase|nr:type I 3-dehydroquinate dehydratase [Treponema sp.]